MRRVKYRFSHRVGNLYYWTRPCSHWPGCEEIVSCNVDWFWGRKS